MYIGDIITTSTVDWPGKVVTTIFFEGCPLRCGYCSNAKLFEKQHDIPMNNIRKVIESAKPFIDAVVISGGEPLLQFTPLRELTAYCKETGLKVAVHTNGLYPERLETLINDGSIDAVMLDVKALPQDYKRATGIDFNIMPAINLCNKYRNKLDYYEARTTVFQGLCDTPAEIRKISAIVDPHMYVLQQGRPEIAWTQEYRDKPMITRDQLARLSTHSIRPVKIRGI